MKIFFCSLFAYLCLLSLTAFAQTPLNHSNGIFIYSPITDSDTQQTIENAVAPFKEPYPQNLMMSYHQGHENLASNIDWFLYIDLLSFDGDTLSNSYYGVTQTAAVIPAVTSAYKTLWGNVKIILVVDLDIDGSPTPAQAATLVAALKAGGNCNESHCTFDGILFDLESQTLLSTQGEAFLNAVAGALPSDTYLLLFSAKAKDPAGAWTLWHAMNRDTPDTCTTTPCQPGFWVLASYDFDNPETLAEYNTSVANQFNILANNPPDGFWQSTLPAAGSAFDSAQYEFYNCQAPNCLAHASAPTQSDLTQAAWTSAKDSNGNMLYSQKTPATQCLYVCAALNIANSLLGGTTAANACGGLSFNTPPKANPKFLGVALYQLQASHLSYNKCATPLVPGVTQCPIPIPYPESVEDNTWNMVQNWSSSMSSPTTPICES